MLDYLTLGFGVLLAGVGGELFIRGAVGLAHWARVSPGIIASTVVAFATSSPELSVSISAALAGRPQISLGDALGSNLSMSLSSSPLRLLSLVCKRRAGV